MPSPLMFSIRAPYVNVGAGARLYAVIETTAGIVILNLLQNSASPRSGYSPSSANIRDSPTQRNSRKTPSRADQHGAPRN